MTHCVTRRGEFPLTTLPISCKLEEMDVHPGLLSKSSICQLGTCSINCQTNYCLGRFPENKYLREANNLQRKVITLSNILNCKSTSMPMLELELLNSEQKEQFRQIFSDLTFLLFSQGY